MSIKGKTLFFALLCVTNIMTATIKDDNKHNAQ